MSLQYFQHMTQALMFQRMHEQENHITNLRS